MILFSILVIIFANIIGIITAVYNIHIFQLNSYEYNVHFRWALKQHFIFSLIRILPKKNAKKPLEWTARVKRLFFTLIIIYIIIDVFFYLCVVNSPVFIAIFCFLIFILISPAIPLFANLINTPIERGIKKHYIDDAKKILNSHKSLIIIGITGSYGKTSMKYFLSEILKVKYNLFMTPESYNTPMGIVKTIRENLSGVHEIFVCEMGAKYKGEIKEITDIVNPRHGIITNIGKAHLDTFRSIENIIDTKFELAKAIKNKGKLFVNGDNQYIRENFGRILEQDFSTYGLNKENDFYSKDIELSEVGTKFVFNDSSFQTKLIGEHNIVNLTGAIAMAKFLGLSDNEIKKGLKNVVSVPHRLELINKGSIIVIDDAYNSNPEGARAALNTLNLFSGPKVIITPGMVELGNQEEELNFEFGKEAGKIADLVLLVGDNKRTAKIKEGIFISDKEKNVMICKNVLEGMNTVVTKMDKAIVLLENDLPDNY